jgi:polygalacturonase
LTPIVLPSKGSNVAIKNIKIEGNRSGPNAIVSDPHGSPWLPGIAISNVNGLTLDTVWIYDAPTYAFIGDNISNVTVLNSRFESPSHAINTDGFHVDGPADHITVSGGYFYTGDDAIALNAPEGYSGTIVNVAITNPGVNTGSLNGLREYGTVQSVTVNGCVLADTSNLGVGSSVRISPATLDAYNCTPPTTGGIALRGSVSLRGLSTTR